MSEANNTEQRIIPAVNLPEGWEWRFYDDGSGGLYSPDNKCVVEVDFATSEYRQEGKWHFMSGYSHETVSHSEFMDCMEKSVRSNFEREGTLSLAQAALYELHIYDDEATAALRERLIERLDGNLAELHGLLETLGLDEQSTAAKIAVITETHDYILTDGDMTVKEMEHLLRFKNPLQIVADVYGGIYDLQYALNRVIDDYEGCTAGYALMSEPLPEPTGSGYLIAVTDDSDYYIPNALHIQRDDSLAVYPDDEAAAAAAEVDGIKLIYGMPDVPDGVYLDTPENRAVITDYNNTRDELLALIAKKHCRVETLETRKSDSLDFHEVSVWGLKSALEEAYNAGIAHQRAKINDVDRADAPDYEKLERQLRDRLAENYNVYKRDMLELGKEGLFYAAAEILPVQEAYSYFTHEHVFTESDVDFLLKFENPLELISDRWSDGPVETTGRIDAIFFDMERTLQSGGYMLASNDSAPAASEPAHEAAATGAGEKTSVLDRIKQHAKDTRDRPSAPKDKTDRRKTEPEH